MEIAMSQVVAAVVVVVGVAVGSGSRRSAALLFGSTTC